MKKLIWFVIRHFLSFKKEYCLIILQNNNELRSTGGFITSVFEVEIGRWQVKKKMLRVETDLCKHEKIKAPKAIQEMLFDSQLKTWTFRDGNYSPDFGKTAIKLIEFYHLVYPENSVAGLLAINFSFIEGWLKILGPLSLGDEVVDYKRLFIFLSATTSDIDRHDLDALNERKMVLNSLAKKMILKSLIKPWLWLKLIIFLKRSFLEKELQLYETNTASSFGFNAKNNEDFFAVIENNYLGLKSNRYITRTIHHDSRITPEGNLINMVRVRWEHFGLSNYPLSGKYTAHVRFYISKEASLEAGEGYEIYEESELKVLSIKVLLKPKEVVEKRFKYSLPKSFIEKKYKFRFFKQSGVKNELLRKSFSLPLFLSFKKEGNLSFTEGFAFKSYENISKDALFEAKIEKSKDHPRVYSHAIVSPNQVLVKFNEAIYFKEEEKFISMREKTDPDKLIKVEDFLLLNEGKWLLINLKDLPNKEEAFYCLTLNNILNANGISIKPNPKKLTVVYRSRHFHYWQKQLSASI